MSHFIRCDRCDKQDVVLGTLSLPPGWQNICHADLCEPCCLIVRDFIRFKPSDAARLSLEPMPESLSNGQASDKLFEIAPEAAPQVSADSQMVSEHASNGKLVPGHATDGDPDRKTQLLSAESSTEERARTHRVKKTKMQGQDAILPDVRPKPTEHIGPGGPA